MSSASRSDSPQSESKPLHDMKEKTVSIETYANKIYIYTGQVGRTIYIMKTPKNKKYRL